MVQLVCFYVFSLCHKYKTKICIYQKRASRPKSQPWGPNPNLEAQIPTLRPKSQPQGPNLSLQAQPQPQDSNPSLKAQISATRLKSPPLSSNPSFKDPIPYSRLKWKQHRSSAPLGPLPLSPPHTLIYSHRGNGYRWPSNAFATILFLFRFLFLHSVRWIELSQVPCIWLINYYWLVMHICVLLFVAIIC